MMKRLIIDSANKWKFLKRTTQTINVQKRYLLKAAPFKALTFENVNL
jgi:hypothetical protein